MYGIKSEEKLTPTVKELGCVTWLHVLTSKETVTDLNDACPLPHYSVQSNTIKVGREKSSNV